jgi:hypothetical protein
MCIAEIHQKVSERQKIVKKDAKRVKIPNFLSNTISVCLIAIKLLEVQCC